MAVDIRAGKAREKARQEKNRYKRRALDAEAQVACLEAANAAKDVALTRVLQNGVQHYKDDTGRCFRTCTGCPTESMARAALSDQGEGWLPPEAWRLIWIMREVARIIGGRDDPQMMTWYYAAQSELWRVLRAARDKLGGT